MPAAPRAYAEKNLALVAALQAGDAAAAEELLTLNAGLVAEVARKYRQRCRSLDYEDLEIEAQLGLLRAARSFDPGRGTAFGTYATWWVRQAVGRAVEQQDRMIRAPSHAVRRSDLPEVVSIDEPIDEDGRTLADLLAAPDDPEAVILAKLEIEEALSCLSGRERFVVLARAAGDGLRDVGQVMGCSRENVRQIQARAQERMRDSLP